MFRSGSRCALSCTDLQEVSPMCSPALFVLEVCVCLVTGLPVCLLCVLLVGRIDERFWISLKPDRNNKSRTECADWLCVCSDVILHINMFLCRRGYTDLMSWCHCHSCRNVKTSHLSWTTSLCLLLSIPVALNKTRKQIWPPSASSWQWENELWGGKWVCEKSCVCTRVSRLQTHS